MPNTQVLPTWAELTFTQRAGVAAYWATRYADVSKGVRALWWNRGASHVKKAALLAAIAAAVQTQADLDREDSTH